MRRNFSHSNSTLRGERFLSSTRVWLCGLSIGMLCCFFVILSLPAVADEQNATPFDDSDYKLPVVKDECCGDIDGRVLLQGSTDSSGVFIYIEGTDIATVSARSGLYALKSVPIGTVYTVIFKKEGYRAVVKHDLWTAGKATYMMPKITMIKEKSIIDIKVSAQALYVSERASSSQLGLNVDMKATNISLSSRDFVREVIYEDTKGDRLWQKYISNYLKL